MVTLGVALVLRELANQNGWLTGGADGLQGVTMAADARHVPLRYVRAQRLRLLPDRAVRAVPAGAADRAIRRSACRCSSIKDNPLRAAAIGITVNCRLVAIYTIAAGYAGIAGALLAQTQAFASLAYFDFERSADLLLVLIIGGTGYLYGGLIGADRVQVHARLSLGAHAAILAVLDRPAAGRHRAGRARAHQRLDAAVPHARRHVSTGARYRKDGALIMAIALETIGLEKRFGGIVATNNVSLKVEKGARHALIGPNGAGKTTLINLLTGVLTPDRRQHPARRRGHHAR